MAERGYGSGEKHFPSRISLQVTPTQQSDVVSVSVSKSSDNPTQEIGLEKALEGGFEPPGTYLGIRVSTTETVTVSVKPWKFEQSVHGASGKLNWFLHDGINGREVFSSKPSKFSLLQPRAWFRDRYSSVYRPFTKDGGVIFAGDEYGESVWWKVGPGAFGKTMGSASTAAARSVEGAERRGRNASRGKLAMWGRGLRRGSEERSGRRAEATACRLMLARTPWQEEEEEEEEDLKCKSPKSQLPQPYNELIKNHHHPNSPPNTNPPVGVTWEDRSPDESSRGFGDVVAPLLPPGTLLVKRHEVPQKILAKRFGLSTESLRCSSQGSARLDRKRGPSSDTMSEHLYLYRRVGRTRVTSLLQNLTGHQSPVVGGVVHWSIAAPTLTRRLLPTARGYYSSVGHCAYPDTPPVSSCQGVLFVGRLLCLS
ncbi:hypothetical protein B296_00007653 [Ensete ventricosum]|uniref:Uncharacterized protein n=1 Tax=Ensete ventricosum TaxID=4639 RepID=A0A426YF88_ENSVE|nr:hypothetical protein B296_00007653 [Ensete ventricosum]